MRCSAVCDCSIPDHTNDCLHIEDVHLLFCVRFIIVFHF